MTGKAKKRLATLAAALLTFIGITFAVVPEASAASGTISGTITCVYDNNAEVGVWVNAASGTDGWASKWPNAYGGIDYSYTLSQSSSYELHIGCGGTSSSWARTFYTYPDTSVNGQYYDWICSFVSGVGYVCYES